MSCEGTDKMVTIVFGIRTLFMRRSSLYDTVDSIKQDFCKYLNNLE